MAAAGTTGFGLIEYNLAGSGVQVGASHVSEVDRNGTEFLLRYGQAFDGWTTLNYEEGRFSDGSRRTALLNVAVGTAGGLTAATLGLALAGTLPG